MKLEMLYQDRDNPSLVASAIGSKGVEMFEVVIGAISDGPTKLTEQEVCLQGVFLSGRFIRLDNDHALVFV